jgi:hypothetical protein
LPHDVDRFLVEGLATNHKHFIGAILREVERVDVLVIPNSATPMPVHQHAPYGRLGDACILRRIENREPAIHVGCSRKSHGSHWATEIHIPFFGPNHEVIAMLNHSASPVAIAFPSR